ncbi:MAG: GerMN domain-containing protein [Firmicutes bacterium]|nr:GerMN domain-containing protein [Bacillota bacterium]
MEKKSGYLLILLVLAVGLFLLLVYPGFFRRGGEEPPPTPSPATEERTTIVRLYFVNQEYIQTGREDLPKFKAVEREVKFKEDNLINVVLQELREPPADEGLSTALHDRLTIHRAWVEGDLAYIDFSSENLYGGSLQETLLVHQIVKTITGLPGIEQVQFLVDGEKRESLMGHISTNEPLSLENL